MHFKRLNYQCNKLRNIDVINLRRNVPALKYRLIRTQYRHKDFNKIKAKRLMRMALGTFFIC